ncbi:MAG TPA: response regulator [Nitrospiraceae bacterium]|jgi:DNA-binding NtrC family response regulator|nr:response regulator [Nitrospiraceae bacterium]
MKKAEKDRTSVLVVDNEIEFASTLAERLQMRGYDATAVYCTEDAFESIKKSPPDVLLLDLIMPGTSGMEALMNVKTCFPDVFVVLMTGRLDIEKELEGIKLDNFTFIIKPVDLSALTVMIDRAKIEMMNKKRLLE